MNSLAIVSSLFLVAVLSAQGVNSASVHKKLIRAPGEAIDNDGKYLLGWMVDLDLGTITFNVTVESTAFIGLGVSPSGSMTQADIFIGGVFPNGTSYSGDYYSSRNGNPVLDAQQDWVLEDFSETATHTNLVVSRPIKVTDIDDNDINDGDNFVIWSYGFTDVIEYHDRTQRGSKPLNLLA